MMMANPMDAMLQQQQHTADPSSSMMMEDAPLPFSTGMVQQDNPYSSGGHELMA